MAQRYWVATSGGTWNSTSSWSATSGGASGASIPTAYDDVFFDANSITSANRVVTISNDTCRNLDCTAITNNPVFRIINIGDLNVYGSVYLPATGMTWQPVDIVSGILLSANNRTVFLDTNGQTITLGYITAIGTGLRVEVLSELKTTGTFGGSVTGQTFVTNNNTITSSSVVFNETTTLDTGTSIFNINTVTGGSAWSVPSASTTDLTDTVINVTNTGTCTFTGSTHNYGTINIYGSGTLSMNGNTGTIDTLNIASPTVNLSGSKKIINLTVQSGATCGLGNTDLGISNCTNNGTINITSTGVYIDTLTVGRSSATKPTASITLNINNLINTSVSGALAVIESATAGESAYIKLATGVFNNDYLDLQDITLVGGGTWYAGANSTNGGNVGNVIFAALPEYLDDKLISYIIYNSLGGSVLGVLDNVINGFSFSNEINTGGGSFDIELKDDPNSNYDNGLYDLDNHVEVWVKDRQAPNGTRVFQGYINSTVFDYDTEKITLKVSGYGDKLDKYIILTADTVDQSVTTTDGEAISLNQYTSYAYYQFTTGAGITNLSSIEMMLEPYFYYVGVLDARIKIFTSASAAENISIDNSIGTTAYTTLGTSGAYIYKMTFTEPITVSASTTYYYRLEIVNTLGQSGTWTTIHGDNSAGASAGVKVYDSGTWYYPSYVSKDTIYPYLNTYTNAEDTTITYSTTEISEIFKAIVDSYNSQGGELIYTPLSIETTGTEITHTFNTDNVKNGLDLCRKAAPRGWFYYVDNATNIIYFRAERSIENIDYVLPKGSGLSNVKLIVDGDNLVNTVYFTGGDTGGGDNLFTKYIDEASIISHGKRATSVSDGRVTVSATASGIGEAILDQYAESNILIEASIADNNKGTETIGYDLESLKLGQNLMITGYSESALWDSAIIGVDEWDSYLQALSNQVLQIVRIDYTLNKVTFKLNIPSLTIFKTITDNKRNVDVLNTTNNPANPS